VATDEAIIPSAVEESLRYYSMIFGNGRKVGQDVEWHGVHPARRRHGVRPQHRRNRDPKVFEDPTPSRSPRC